MTNASRCNRGVALYMAIGSILIALIITSIILNIMLSQARLTHHQVSRIQAYYATQAANNLAIEMLRSGTWPVPASGSADSYNLCGTAGCSAGGVEVIEGQLPATILRVIIEISNRAADTGPRNTLRIQSQSLYTFT